MRAMAKTRSVHPPSAPLAFALALAGCAASAAPGVLLLPAVGRPTHVSVFGRVLREAPADGSSALSRNLRRLAARNWEGAPVEVSFLGRQVNVTSGHDGAFEAAFPAPAQEAFPVGVHVVKAKVPGAEAEASVEVVSDAAPFLVISDFDDTVARSDIVSKAGMLRSGLLEDGDTHPEIEGMAGFYRCLREGKQAAPGFAFVSGSPVQFGPRMQAFMAKHRVPPAAFYLRDLGPSTLSGYKQPAIRALLSQFPEKVLLVGDNGEKDPEVYAQIRDEFPGRVIQIYIRDAGGPGGAERVKGVLFSKAVDAAKDALARGLISQACLAREFPETSVDRAARQGL